MRDELGDWIRNRLKAVQKHNQAANQALKACGILIEELRAQWKDQQTTQLSLRTREFLYR